MTTPPDPADDSSTPPEPTPPSDQPVPAETASQPVNPEGSEQAAKSTEGLPEWEPLTPELVEDEAIRGDFVIRWAVVGLALLLGIAPITDTRTLVHIRSGEYLTSHGFLPPSRDVFSYTATDRTWVNLSWLYDIITSVVHSVSGGIGLSILQGLLAGVTFGLLTHTVRSEIRTWWGSICAALALLVCYPQFTAQPELITLVGLAVVLWIAHRADETKNPKLLWSSVAVVWLWSQLDSRAFLGWMFLLAMAAGEFLRKGDEAKQRQAHWLRVALVSLAVTVIHPFLWEAWLSPVHLFAIDYPALQQFFPKPGRVELGFYPITFATFWTSINHDSIAGLVLFAATLVTMFLNRERLHPGHVLAVILFNSLGCLATHELAAASLVNCVVCTLNAQQWYSHRFGQVYSVDWRELLFSRGGRAVTVVCFFTLAWVAISGRIDGPAGRRTGLGFHDNLQVQMDSYQQLAADQMDDRPFHFAARQGDLLIWSGRKTFVDTRAGLFSGSGDNNLIKQHDITRRAMQVKRPHYAGSGDPEVWQATFAKYKLTHAMPRLSGPVPGPDYITFTDLLSTEGWVLTQLNASTAVFYYDDKSPAIADYLSKHRLDFVEKAFRQIEKKLPETSRVCAKAPTLTDTLFSVRQPRYPAGSQQAAHFDHLAGSGGAIPSRVRAACALLAIRNATAGLREDSDSADGYRTLGLSYFNLDGVETSVMNEAGLRWQSPFRYLQSLGALHQAALLNPDDLVVQYALLTIFQRNQRIEPAMDAIRQIKRIKPVNENSSEREREERGKLLDAEEQLGDILVKIEVQADQQLQNQADRFQVAALAYQAGAVKLAIRTLEDAPIYKEQNPMARIALGNWLIETGRVQEGLDTLEQASLMGSVPTLRDAVATSLVINGEYQRAIAFWQEQVRESKTNGTQSALLTLPFLTLNPVWMGADNYPLTHAAAAAEIMGNVRAEYAALTFQIGLSQLEQGDIAAATITMQDVLNNAPDSPLRPLVTFYLEAITDKKIEVPVKEAPVQEEFFPLGEEPPAKDDVKKQDDAGKAPDKSPEKK